MICAVLSDAGCRNGENQDRLAVNSDQGTFVVADGMGGLADAAATAQAVVDQLPRLVSGRLAVLTEPSLLASVTAMTAELNEQIRRSARYGPGNTGASTALLLVRGRCAVSVHLGDSRIYLVRGSQAIRLTEDHALATGELTQFVGMGGTVMPGVSRHLLCRGDRLLLCTDGLVESLDDLTVGTMLHGSRDLREACRTLVKAARAGGATDDISMIALEYRPQAVLR